MSKQFKVGDVAILQNGVGHPELDGEEVEILEGLAVRRVKVLGEIHEYACYKVRLVNKPMPGGVGHLASAPHQLRPKRPPRRDIDEVVSWEECGWMPMHIKLDLAFKEAMGERA